MIATNSEPRPIEVFSASRAVLTATAIVVLGAGLLSSTAAVRAANEGFDTRIIGLLGSANYAGFLLGALLGPRLVTRVGHIRVYAALASLAASFTLLLPAVVQPVVWFPARFILGLAMSGIYVVVESWLNATSTNDSRGRLLALYLVISNVAFGAGQVLFIWTDPDSYTPFLAASAIASMSVIPLSLSTIPAPVHDTTHRGLPIRAVIVAAPLAPLTSLMSGIGISVIVSLGAVYGTRTGMTAAEIGLFVAIGSLGGIVLQWPIGSLSDRYPRRLVILFVNLGAAAMALAGAYAPDASVLVFVAVGAYAAISYPLYSLAMSHLNDVLAPDLRIPAAGVLILAYGSGSVIGPAIGSSLLDWDPTGFWLTLALSNLAITPYVLYRILTRPRIQQQGRHVPFSAEITPDPSMLVDHDEDPAWSADRSGGTGEL